MTQISTLEALRAIIPPPHPLTTVKILDYLDVQAQEFVKRAPFLLLATQNADGSLEVSPKGDEPGFVHVEDERTLLIPDRVGNNMAIGLINLLTNPEVGLIFILPATGDTLRVSGRATLHDDADMGASLSTRGKPAKLFLRIAVTRAYFHCARSLLRANLWRPESWGPKFKISIGRVLREQGKCDDATIARVDEHVERSYQPENL